MAQYRQTTSTTFDPAVSSPKGRGSFIWLRIASYGSNAPLGTVEHREKVRRSRLMAWILLGLFLVTLAVLPLGVADPATLAAVLAADVLLLVATVLNRAGWISLAGGLVVVTITGAIFSSLLNQPGGKLPLDALPAYDLLAMTVVIAATVLPGSSAFLVAVVNSALIAADFLFQPHAADLIHDLPPNVGPMEAALALISRPIALQIILAVMAFLWVRSTESAIRRADRAEEIASLEHSLAEQKRQLDVGIQQILQTHVRVANGDFSARTPLGQDNVLWQIAVSLNNLLARLQRTNQTEYLYQRTQEEITRIVAAIDDMQAGRRPIWPAPTGTPVDALLERLVQAAYISGPPARAPHSQPNSQPLPYGQPGPTSQPVPYRADPGALGGLPPMGAPNRAPYSAPPSFPAPGSMPTTRAPHSGAPFLPTEHPDRAGLPSMPANPWAFPLDEE